MNTTLCIALIALLLPSAFALTTDSAQLTVAKGQALAATGTCASEVDVQLTTATGAQLLRVPAPCVDGHYRFERVLNYLYPSGAATMRLSENGQTQDVAVTISPTRESGFLTITVQKPTQQIMERHSTLQLEVLLTDAGTPQTDAQVQTWAPDGTQVMLSPAGEGLYTGQIAVPYDANLGAFALVLTAQNQDGTSGGEQAIAQEIRPARLTLSIEKPVQTNLLASIPIEFRVKATYGDQTALKNPVARITLNTTTAQMSPIDPQTFSYTTTFSKDDVGTLSTVIRITDDANNTAEQSLDLFVTASLPLQLENYTPYAVGLLVIAIVCWLVVLPHIRQQKTQGTLEQQAQHTEQEITELQRAYFENRSVSPEQYQQKSAALERQLTELNKQIKSKKP
jgi:hypothetical protein